MEFQYYPMLLFISFFSLIVFNSAQEPSLSPDSPPNLQSSSSPTLALSTDEVYIPQTIYTPSISDPPSESIAPSTEGVPPPLAYSTDHFSIPPGAYPPSEAVPPFNSDAPESALPFASSADHVSLPPDTYSPTESDAQSESIASSITTDSNAPSESVPSSTNIHPTIKKIADSTDFPDLFVSTVVPLLKGKSDITSVLEVAMKVSTDLTNSALLAAKKAAEMPGTPPEMISILGDCSDSYDTAVYNFQHAMDALAAHDIGTMNTMLTAVLTDVGDCEDGFTGMSSPLSAYAEKVTKMTSNCLAIISLIH
ncbi:unnamed protein product [Ilex paraguariensis]|uniref:Pectinesterase inhibitor domain-containing protein n=1 Tax=Ilex paraguariensis TaxID=185542 RepID=A0ABC8R1N1_9AQUA